MIRALGFAAAALLVSAGAPAAHAATASVEQRCDNQPKAVPVCFNVLTYTGAPGEANRLRILPGTASGQVRLRDEGAPVTPGSGCTAAGPSEVDCAFHVIEVALGDRDDSVAMEVGAVLTADGGAGADVLTGGPSADQLLGGDGPDRLEGQGGVDRLDGGLGSDLVSGGADGDFLDDGDASGAGGSDDRLSGGSGRDELSYARRGEAVRIDLSAGRAGGSPGEDDSLAGIEIAIGGGAGDRIVGGPGRDTLEGRAGNDVIEGMGGVDRIDGGGGEDRLDGGAGRDYIVLFPVRDGGSDRATCGAGFDVVEAPDRRDLLERDCERIEAFLASDSMPIPAQPARVTATAIVFRVPCPNDVEGCGGAINVRRPGAARPLGRATWSFPDNEVDRYLSIPVDVGATRSLRGKILEVRMQDATHELCEPCGWRVRLR